MCVRILEILHILTLKVGLKLRGIFSRYFQWFGSKNKVSKNPERRQN